MVKTLKKSTNGNTRKTMILSVVIPLFSCIVFMIFCMLNLNSTIWFDESYSAYLVRGNFGEIWNMTSMDVHPPFFYFLLKIWSNIFGYTDFSMRFMSVFFGAMTLIFLFHLLKRWFGIKMASIATVITAFSPMLIRYGQEMRMYTLVAFIVVAATYVLDLALSTKKTKYYILYGILISLGMWTHYFTAIAWIAHIVYYKFTKRGKIFDKKMLMAYILGVVLFIPWMPSLFKQVVEVQSGFWIPSISLVTPVDYLSQSLMYSEAGYATGWLVLIALAAIIPTIYFVLKFYKEQKKDGKYGFWFLITLVAVPPSILIILSLPPLTSMFIDRYILYSAMLIWTVIGLAAFYAISSMKQHRKDNKYKIALVALAVGVIGCAITGIVNVTNRAPEGFVKETILAVQAISEENEPILMNNEWNYYDAVFYSKDKHPVYGVDEWINYQYGSIFPIREFRYNLIDDIKAFVDEHQKIWYVTDLNDASKESKLEHEILSDNYRIVTTIADDRLVAFELEKK